MPGEETPDRSEGAVFQDRRVDRVVSWILLALVGVTSWFVRDTLQELRDSQRSTEASVTAVGKTIAVFQVEIAVLKAQLDGMNDLKAAMGRMEARLLELERASRREK